MPERDGLIAEASGGTLFLDEIGELPPHLQAHLLRVLDRGGEYQRLGDGRPRRSDLRVIAATNRPIEALKHDFAARFSLRVELPGLAARREDIPLLFSHLLRAACQSNSAVAERFFEKRAGPPAEPRIAPQLVDALLRHGYTHHLRELERLMWVGLSTSTDSFITLTPQLQAELRFDSAGEATPLAKPQAASAEPPEITRAEIEAALAQARG